MSTTINLTANASNATSRPTIDPAFADYWNKSHWIDFSCRIILVTFGLTLTVLGLISIYRAKGLQPYGFVRILYSMFLCMLVNKLLVMVFDIIQWGHRYHWPMGDALCRIHNFLSEAMEGAISYQLLMVSGYMVLAIKKPTWTQLLDTKKGANIFLGVFWFLVVAFNAEALGSSSTRDYESFTTCWARGRTRTHWRIIVYGYILFLMYVPWFLLAGMAGYLYYYYRSQIGVQYYRTDGGSHGNARDNFRLSTAFAAMFTFCRGPLIIVYTRWVLGYWTFHWNIAFWFTMDLMFFLYDVYSAVLPLFFLLFLSDLRFEARCLLSTMTGRAPPAYSKELSDTKGTEDESNLI